MITFDNSTIILAVVGMIGVISTAVVVGYSFKRNRTARGNYQ